jgi:hypothetical protein
VLKKALAWPDLDPKFEATLGDIAECIPEIGQARRFAVGAILHSAGTRNELPGARVDVDVWKTILGMVFQAVLS